MSLYSSLTQVLAPFAAKINGLLTGWDGTKYSTPGEAVRQQIADLHVLIGDEPGTAISASAISYGESDVETALNGVNGHLQSVQRTQQTVIDNVSQIYGKNLFNPFWMSMDGITSSADNEYYGVTRDFYSNTESGKIPFSVPTGTQVTISFEAYVEPVQGDSNVGLVLKAYRIDGTTLSAQISIPNNTAEWTQFSMAPGKSAGINGLQFAGSSNTRNITHIRNIQIEYGSAVTEYENPLTAHDKKAEESLVELSDGITRIDATITDKEERIEGIVAPDFFIYGNIVFSENGFTYNLAVKNGIITPEEYTLDLKAGDTITLKDYDTYRFYPGWLIEKDGSVKYGWRAWITSGTFVCPIDANYKLVIRRQDNTPISDISEAAATVVIHKNESYDGRITQNLIHHIVDTSPVRCVAHRGYRSAAPENTAPAFKLARTKGYNWVECDVWPTSDGHYVIIHDNSVNRTSDGEGNVYEMTLSELQALDFGAWFSPDFIGTKILTFEEFIVLCRTVGLKAYIELKHDATFTAWTQEQIDDVVSIVRNNGYLSNVVWIDFGSANLLKVINADQYAFVGILENTITSSTITSYNNLRATTDGEVFVDANFSMLTADGISIVKNAGARLEVYGANYKNQILACDGYVSGFTAEDLIPSVVLYQSAIA